MNWDGKIEKKIQLSKKSFHRVGTHQLFAIGMLSKYTRSLAYAVSERKQVRLRGKVPKELNDLCISAFSIKTKTEKCTILQQNTIKH